MSASGLHLIPTQPHAGWAALAAVDVGDRVDLFGVTLTATQFNAVWTVVVVLVAVVIRGLTLREIHRRVDDPDIAYTARKSVVYTIAVLTLLVLAWIWIEPLGNAGTALGLMSAGVAIALADLLRNFAGWIYVVARRPFRVDDRIEVGDMAGDVIDIRMFRTTMLEIREWVDADQSTGRIVHVPNGIFLREAVANFTQGFAYVWHEVAVLVTFESDWEKAEQVMLEVLTELTADVCERARAEIRHANRQYKIRYSHFDAKIWVRVEDSGVRLTGRMLVPVRSRRGYDEKAWRGLLMAFRDDPTIDFAYPTVRTFLHDPIRLAP
ncbi:MAG TPA: mechanosensitive ion channel domain-containing protein [Nitriliruptorales bacterium]